MTDLGIRGWHKQTGHQTYRQSRNLRIVAEKGDFHKKRPKIHLEKVVEILRQTGYNKKSGNYSIRGSNYTFVLG